MAKKRRGLKSHTFDYGFISPIKKLKQHTQLKERASYRRHYRVPITGLVWGDLVGYLEEGYLEERILGRVLQKGRGKYREK